MAEWTAIAHSVIFWTWLVFASLDIASGLMGWMENRSTKPKTREERTANRLSKVMFAGAQRSAVTIVALLTLGVNSKAALWFLAWGCWAVIYKAYSTWGWLLYARGVINGGGWWALVRPQKYTADES